MNGAKNWNRLPTGRRRVDLRRGRFKGALKAEKIPASIANAFVARPLGIDTVVGLDLTAEGPFSAPAGKGTLTIGALAFDATPC